MPKVYMDEANQLHVSQRIRERFPNQTDQRTMVEFIKRLTSMDAPPAAVGEYMWHVNVPHIGRVVMRGHSVRTVYSLNENFPGSTAYKIQGNMLIRS